MEAEWIVYISIRIVMGSLAMVANGLTIFCVARFTYLRSRTANVLIALLAVNDFMHGSLTWTVLLARKMARSWYVMHALCLTGIYIETTTVFMQLTTFAFLALERRNSLLYQLSRARKYSYKYVLAVTVMAWALIALWNGVMTALYSAVPPGTECNLFLLYFPRYYMYIMIVVFMLESGVTATCYSHIAWIAYRSSHRVRHLHQHHPHQQLLVTAATTTAAATDAPAAAASGQKSEVENNCSGSGQIRQQIYHTATHSQSRVSPEGNTSSSVNWSSTPSTTTTATKLDENNKNRQQSMSGGTAAAAAQTNAHNASVESTDMRITRMMAQVVGLFFALYVPFAVMLNTMRPDAPMWHVVLYHVCIVIYDVNFWINPVVYAWRDKNFLRAFRQCITSVPWLNRCLKGSTVLPGSHSGTGHNSPANNSHPGGAEARVVGGGSSLAIHTDHPEVLYSRSGTEGLVLTLPISSNKSTSGNNSPPDNIETCGLTTFGRWSTVSPSLSGQKLIPREPLLNH